MRLEIDRWICRLADPHMRHAAAYVLNLWDTATLVLPSCRSEKHDQEELLRGVSPTAEVNKP